MSEPALVLARPAFFRSLILALARPLALLVAWTALFGVFRGVLIAASWPLHGDATPALLAEAFVHGFRFDLSVAARLVAPFALWMIWRARAAGSLERRVVVSLFAAVALVAILALTAEVEFYKEFQMRLGPLAFEYFGTKSEHNRIVMGMIWHGYPVVRWLLFCSAVWAAFVWVGRRWLAPRTARLPIAPSAVATVLLAAVTVIATRGGLQGSILRWGDAFFSRSMYANHMAQNGLFALADAVRGLSDRARTGSRWRSSLPRDEAIRVAREAILLPGETLVDPEVYPLLRTSPPADLALRKRPKNVVVVIMESFTARFCGAVGSDLAATPRFDALAREGILFDRAFSAGTHTHQGAYATLCSFPNLPEYESLMKHPAASQPFRSLPAILSESGFDTLFLYNGLFSWDNKEGFFRNQGMRRFIGRPDYVDPKFVDPDWGVSDEDVFRRAVPEFDAMAAGGKPFLGVILTLSNHAPFNLPTVPGLERIETGGEQNQRLNGVHYADWAVGEFVDLAKKSPWFDDTLFVFVGDHGFGVPPVLTEANVLHMHVPLLFYGPGVLPPGGAVRHTVAGQFDIVPTILGLLGSGAAHQSFGRDLFSAELLDAGHTYVKPMGDPEVAWIDGEDVVVSAIGREPSLYALDVGFPPGAAPLADTERAAVLQRRLRAFVATGIITLEERLAAPPELARGGRAGR